MNLFYMLQRGSSEIATQGNIKLAKFKLAEDAWRGLQIAPGGTIIIQDVRRFTNMRSFPDNCGWMVLTPEGTSLTIRMSGGNGECFSERRFSGPLQPAWLPWPLTLNRKIDLEIKVDGAGESAFLAISRVVSRDWLLELATGKGVEIGPGPKPQILSDKVRSVRYLEQMPPDRWNQLYNSHGKYPVRKELWSNYIVGDAANLPVDDNELDFIFGSHIFEHLVNPIGHLSLWHTKLAPSGKVICIVPDISGAKDELKRPGCLSEWIMEYKSGIWEPQPHHYARYLQLPINDKKTVRMIESGASIHTHFYNNVNTSDLLEYAVNNLGYSDFIINHTQNAKDFHFVLVK